MFLQSLPLLLSHAPFVLHTAEDKLVLSNRFLHTKTCLCRWNITLGHRLLWISTDALRWRDAGRNSGCFPRAELALGLRDIVRKCWQTRLSSTIYFFLWGSGGGQGDLSLTTLKILGLISNKLNHHTVVACWSPLTTNRICITCPIAIVFHSFQYRININIQKLLNAYPIWVNTLVPLYFW